MLDKIQRDYIRLPGDTDDSGDAPESPLVNFLKRTAKKVKERFRGKEIKEKATDRWHALAKAAAERGKNLKQAYGNRQSLFEKVNEMSLTVGVPVVFTMHLLFTQAMSATRVGLDLTAIGVAAALQKIGIDSRGISGKFTQDDMIRVLVVSLLAGYGAHLAVDYYDSLSTIGLDAGHTDAVYHPSGPHHTVGQHLVQPDLNTAPPAESVEPQVAPQPAPEIPVDDASTVVSQAGDVPMPERGRASMLDSVLEQVPPKAETARLATPVLSGGESSWSSLVSGLKEIGGLDHEGQQGFAHAFNRVVTSEGLKDVLVDSNGSLTQIPAGTTVHFDRLFSDPEFTSGLSDLIESDSKYRPLVKEIKAMGLDVDTFVAKVAKGYTGV
jgi:hypothetical protein